MAAKKGDILGQVEAGNCHRNEWWPPHFEKDIMTDVDVGGEPEDVGEKARGIGKAPRSRGATRDTHRITRVFLN
jgi:hypothetical protein